MHPDLVVPVGQHLERQRVVEVLGVHRVDGEGRRPSHVAALGNFFRRDAGTVELLSFRADALGEGAVEPLLEDDGIHLGVVLSDGSDDLGHLAGRGVDDPCAEPHEHLLLEVVLCQVGHGCHAHLGLARITRYEPYVGVPLLDDPGIGRLAALHDLGHLSHALGLVDDPDRDPVAVERMHAVLRLDHHGKTGVLVGHVSDAVLADLEDALEGLGDLAGNAGVVHGAGCHRPRDAVVLLVGLEDPFPGLGVVLLVFARFRSGAWSRSLASGGVVFWCHYGKSLP